MSIWSFLSYNKEEEKKYIEDIESEDDQNFEEDLSLQKIIFNNMIFENNYFKLYNCDARDICNNIIIWSSNRPLNYDHIDNISRGIKNEGYIMGTFKVMRCGDKYRIFDGQHRYHALRKIFDNDSRFNISILAEVYEVDDFDSDKGINLFKNANNIKNVEINDTPSIIAQLVCKELQNKYPGVIVECVDSKRINRPRIDKRIFIENLKRILYENTQDNIQNRNYPNTVESILKSIENKNKEYSKLSIKQYKSKDVKIAMHKKAKEELFFYLGLEKDINVWLQTLEIKE